MNKFMKLALISTVVGMAVTAPAMAAGHSAKIQKYIDSNVRGWLASPVILKAVDQQNLSKN